MNRTKLLPLSLLALAVMLLTSCGGGETSTASSKSEAAATQTAPTPQPVVEDRSASVTPTAELTVEEALLKRGRIVWFKCRSCHETSIDGPHKVGPSLHGLMDSAAGAKEDFVYSDAMKNSGIIWTEDTLDSFIGKPSAYIKGTKMAFVGIKKESDRQAVIAYIKENTQPDE